MNEVLEESNKNLSNSLGCDKDNHKIHKLDVNKFNWPLLSYLLDEFDINSLRKLVVMALQFTLVPTIKV